MLYPERVLAASAMNPKLFYHGKILIVDDELANIQLLEKILTRAGYENVSMTTAILPQVKHFSP